jgi:glycosyltransferase involved in cell wall biosynthesis
MDDPRDHAIASPRFDETDATSRLRVLFVTFEPGMGGPQRWLDDVLRDEAFCAVIDARVWHVADLYRGALGKLRLLRECARQLRQHRPQRVYLSHDLNVAALTAFCFRVLGAPHILVHSHNARYYDDESHWKPRLYRAMVRHCSDSHIALSPEAAIAMYGNPPGPWTQIADFIDFDKLWRESGQHPDRQRDGVFTFGCVGRLCHQKNQELAIRALAEVRKAGAQARLLLLGEGPLEHSYRELARELQLGNAVEFVGNVDNVGVWYRHVFDALLVPSCFEGQGRIVGEAQLFGLPVIVSAGVPQVAFLDDTDVNRVDGFDVESWVAAMARTVVAVRPSSDPRVDTARGHPTLSMTAGVRALVATINRLPD